MTSEDRSSNNAEMRVDFTFSSRVSYLRVVRSIVSEFCVLAGADRSEVNWLVQATDEAIANAIEHAYEGGPEGVVRAGIELHNGVIEIRVSDQGKGFNFEPNEPFDLDAYLATGNKKGLGLHMIRRMAGEVNYATANGWNTLTMRRQLRGEPASGR